MWARREVEDTFAAEFRLMDHRIAIEDGAGAELTEADLAARVAERATALRELNCIPGNIWGWIGVPDAPGIVELLAIRETGATLLPLSAGLSPQEGLVALTDAGAVGVSRVTAVTCQVEHFDSVTQQAEPALVPGTVLIRTSGTTGTPRLVLLTPEGIEHHHRAVAERMGLGSVDREAGDADRRGAAAGDDAAAGDAAAAGDDATDDATDADDAWWASLSPAHVGGLMLILRARATGARIVATGGFDAETFLRLAGGGQITHASMVPTMLLRVLEVEGDGMARSAPASGHRPPSHAPTPGRLRAVLIGGAAADPELLRRAAEAGLPVVTTWGMTEASSQVTTATPSETATDPGQSGRPLAGVEVRAVNAGGSGESGEAGELAVRGPTLSPGDLLFGRLHPLPTDEDGWFRTGDLGLLDPQGRVVVTGRAGDRIISGGVNVDPVAVERELRAIEGVRDAAVVGLPDPEWGERVVAAVVLHEGVAVEAVAQAARDRLTGAMRPKKLYRVEALPLNANGKLDRGAVRAMIHRSASS